MPAKGNKRRALRLFIALFALVVIAAMTGFSLWFLAFYLFSGNEHFTLKKVVVKSPGWWKDRTSEVIRKAGIELNKTNLFSIRLKDLRKAVETEPSVEKASASRILPDTLVVAIVERIPRAFLESDSSPWVVDSSGIVMSRESAMNLDKSLPVIKDFPITEKIRPGVELTKIKPALDLILFTRTDFPDFKITYVSMRNADELEFNLYYKGSSESPYKVYMPCNDISFKLKVLRSAIIKSRNSGDKRRTINMTFDGNVIMS